MLIGWSHEGTLSMVITGQLNNVSWLRTRGGQVFLDAVAHAFEVRREPRVIEAVAGACGVDGAAVCAVSQQFDGSDLPLHESEIRALRRT
ncbi:hypothetical protein YSA_00787 [Pseudomonas putida ND6]|uniref:Uncharacterized protein n=1 Tax=Pseudomonas putida ND6 TaxID=231023 RepID=I3UNY3_PSEPU|nr:hypothetical protein YSA_00787 [Pseudomonas putida ND6]